MTLLAGVISLSIPFSSFAQQPVAPQKVSATADPITVINYGDAWKFAIPMADPGVTWRAATFNDSTWKSGPGLFGFSEKKLPDPGLKTPVGAKGDTITYLFRKTFTFNGNPAGMDFSIDQIADDGVVYYLNGKPLGAVRCKPESAWNAVATSSVSNPEEEVDVLTGPATGLVKGTNVLAAEVRQANVGSGDMTFGARLKLMPSTGIEIVYFEYTPDPKYPEDRKLKLKAEKRADGKIYLVDVAEKSQHKVYYTLNGSVNRESAHELSQHPVPPRRWIHFLKVESGVDNINKDGWKLVPENTGGKNQYSSFSEVIFWVKDGPDATPPKLAYTQPLWKDNKAVGDLGIFKQTPAFTLPPYKQYGSESSFDDEPVENLKKVGWKLDENKFRLIYSAGVEALIKHMGVKEPNGVTTFNSEQLDKAADWLANQLPSKVFAVDFEPENPKRDGWWWDVTDGNFRKTLYELSDRIYKKHKKYFYSWIGHGTSFDYKGRRYELDGYANDNWANQISKVSIDDYVAIHENLGDLKNIELPSSSILQVGFGYCSYVLNLEDSKELPSQKYKSPMNWYLRYLDILNLQSAITPKDLKVLCFLWPYEDKSSLRARTRRFQVSNGQGYIRQVDNRVMYPMNMIRDAIFVSLCNPRVLYTNYWMFGSSYDPNMALNNATKDGNPCCRPIYSSYAVHNYTGNDTPKCPEKDALYIGKEMLGVAPMVQAHEMYAKLQTILDGTQVREAFPFDYKRSKGDFVKAEWKNDSGEFTRAFKFEQPWLHVWKHPKTGKRVLLFQDSFADGFEPVNFKVNIGGKLVSRTAEGNNLFVEVLNP